LLHPAPAQAGMCNLPDTGNPIISVNPKPFTVPPPSTCLVDGLPGEGNDLPGYILKASRQADITVSGVKVGDLYDRVYCLGTGETCDSSHTYILATRVRMAEGPVNFRIAIPTARCGAEPATNASRSTTSSATSSA